MNRKYLVKIPNDGKHIYHKKSGKTTYIYYSHDESYNKEKRYSEHKYTCIGKECETDPTMMYPNDNYFRFFAEEAAEQETVVNDLRDPDRSSCLRIGTYTVIRKVIRDLGLDKMLGEIMQDDAGLFLDLAAYTIVTEDNAAQYYPDYAFNHPLFTPDMKIYSDTKISSFLKNITRDQEIDFQNQWNAPKNHEERIYISYDSTNKNCQAGDLELVEIGHPKDDNGKPIFNYAVAYDQNSGTPLFYEEYPGSDVDVSQLHYMVEKAYGYGYRNIGFTLDRGYFSISNIHEMDSYGFAFIMMVKGQKKLVSELILGRKGTFEDKNQYAIHGWNVNGITVPHELQKTDGVTRYFHIFFSENRKAAERQALHDKIEHMENYLEEHVGKKIDLRKTPYATYFDLVYYHEGQKDETFQSYRLKNDVVDAEIALCGYFAIISSEKMSAAEAYAIYKGRDASEKLFRADKTFLGDRTARVSSDEALHSKICIEFVALVIRNQIYRLLMKRSQETHSRHNYMTVPAAMKELEKIEMIRQNDGNYRLNYAVTATQKDILKSFDLDEAKIRKEASRINKELQEAAKKE